MSTEQTAAQYVEKLLDFHLSNRIPPSQFLTWGNLMKCPSLLMDKCLSSLDWDTIPGLFDHVNAIKATHIDFDIVNVLQHFQSGWDHQLQLSIGVIPYTGPSGMC